MLAVLEEPRLTLELLPLASLPVPPLGAKGLSHQRPPLCSGLSVITAIEGTCATDIDGMHPSRIAVRVADSALHHRISCR
jgi:hypothetical protein